MFDAGSGNQTSRDMDLALQRDHILKRKPRNREGEADVVHMKMQFASTQWKWA